MPRKSTRNAQGAGSLRQRADGTWEARYTVGRDPGTGKQIRKSVYGKTQKEARQKLAQAIAAIDRGIYQAPNKITVAAWMEEWLTTFCANKVKPLTLASYSAMIRNHIVPAFGAVELQTVKGAHIQRLYNSMTAAGLSGKTVKNASAILHKAFSIKQAAATLSNRVSIFSPLIGKICGSTPAIPKKVSQPMRCASLQ